MCSASPVDLEPMTLHHGLDLSSKLLESATGFILVIAVRKKSWSTKERISS